VGNLQGAETMLCGGAINGPRQKKVRAKIDPGRGNTYPKLVGRLVESMDLVLWKIETGNIRKPCFSTFSLVTMKNGSIL
jgi:hypothetical protein